MTLTEFEQQIVSEEYERAYAAEFAVESLAHVELALSAEAMLKDRIMPDHRGLEASGGPLFRSAEFGRDQLRTGLLVMEHAELRREIVPMVLTNIVSNIGRKFDRKSEEQPGRVAHEVRYDSNLDPTSKRIFDVLASKWGSSWSEKEKSYMVRYYGQEDADLLFLTLYSKYVTEHDPNFENSQVKSYDGTAVTMREAFDLTLERTRAKLRISRSGLIEYCSTNTEGLTNQVLRDSEEAYVNADGSPINHKLPVSSVELQGLAYDALHAAAKIRPKQALHLQIEAYRLRNQTIAHNWMPEKGCFALGTYYDEAGDLKQIQTLTSNQGELLNTRIFDDMPEDEKSVYISGIVRTLLGPDFLTQVGIRSRALSNKHVVPFSDYHGSDTSWPVLNADLAEGLKRQNLEPLHLLIKNLLLMAIDARRDPETGEPLMQEFDYVDEQGRHLTDLVPVDTGGDEVYGISSTNTAMDKQTWTGAAVIAMYVLDNQLDIPSMQSSWQKRLIEDVILSLPAWVTPDYLNEIEALRRNKKRIPFAVVPVREAISGKFLHEELSKDGVLQ